MEVTFYRKPTEEENKAIEIAIKVLEQANLELIGTRPKSR